MADKPPSLQLLSLQRRQRIWAKDANGNLYYGHDLDSLDPTVVYRSTDSGNTSSAYDAGLPPSTGRQFAVDSGDGRLYLVVADQSSGGGALDRTVDPVQ